MNFFLDDPMNSFVENLLMKSTEKAKRKKPAPGKYNPYDDSPLLAPTSHDGKDPGTPQYGKHWSRHTPRARMAENQMKRRKELQLVLDTIEEKAKKEPKPTKTPKPPRLRGESAAERIKRVKEELAKLRGSSNKQLSMDITTLSKNELLELLDAVTEKAKKTIVIGPGDIKPKAVYGPNHKRLTRYEDGSYGPWQRPPNNKPKDKGEPGDKGKLLSSKRTLPDGTIKWDKATRKRR